MRIAALECTCCEFRLSKCAAIVRLARIIRCDRYRFRIDRQRAVCSRYEIVAYGCLSSCCHCHAVDCRDHIRLCAYISDRAVACHHHCERMRIAALECTCCEAALCKRAAIVRLARITGCDRYLLRRDLEFAVFSRYKVVAYCCLSSCRHCHAVDCRDHVRLGAYVCDRAVACHHDRERMIIAALERACRELRLCQRAAVIRLARITGCDRYLLCRDLEFAVCGRHQIVAYRRSCSCRHCHTVDCRDHVWLGAYVCDRAVVCHHDCELMIVAVFKVCCREFRLRKCAAVIRLARILRCDR